MGRDVAQERPPSQSALGWVLKGALLAVQPLDVALTAWLLHAYVSLGAVEVNPLVEPLTGSRWGFGLLLALKIGLVARLMLARLERPRDFVAFGVAVALYLGVVGWNAWLVLEGASAMP